MISPYHPTAIFREEPWIPRRIPELSFALPPPHFCNTRSRDYRLNSASPAKLPSVVPTGARSSGKRSPAARPQATQPLSSLTRGLRALAVLLLGCAALRHARPGRTAVLVLGLLLLGAAAAEAQTPVTLVQNVGQTPDDSANTSGNKHGQLFHTGANTNGYTLTGMHVSSDDAQGDDFDVEICEADTTANEFPTSTCTALTAPASFTAGLLFFDHTGLALSANTNYVVVITQRGTGSVELDSATSGGEDPTGLSGWSIKDKFYWQSGSTWMLKSGGDEALSIILYGYANTVDTTDATLSALSVSGATLSPAFAAATTDYHAVVANSVTQGTITETTSEATATVEYLDNSDATRTDADTMTAGLQMNLSVGTNIVKVKVTAPDTTTTETYTVNVFRAAVPVACSAASMQNRIWTGNLTVGLSGSASSSATGYAHSPTGIASDYGSLFDTEFDLAGASYDIRSVSISVVQSVSLDDLQLRIRPTLGDRASYLTLHLGSDSFALADATNPQVTTFAWSNHGLTWADGDAVCLALTADGPEVSSVALTSDPGSDNTYAISDTVTATVTFSEAVDITGTPQLELNFDGTAKAAACATGTNTTTMVCEYEVVTNDSAPNGIEIEANKLTGGTIYTTGSTTISADLDHTAVAIDADHKVDGIRPTLVTTGTDAPTTSADGETVLLVFSEAIGAVSHSDITIQANSVTLSTTMASVAGTKVEITLSTALTDTTATLTVALAADAIEDAAANGILAVSATTVTNAVTPTPPGQPAAPSVSSVAGSTTSLLVTWTAPTNTGPAIDTYDLQYREGTSGNWTGPQNETGTSATITGLTANTLYQVQVRATNSDGNSPWSPSGSGQTNTAGNSAPTFPSSTASRSVDENSPAGTDVGAPVTATDIDIGDTLTYTLEGMDASSFSIVSTSGQIRTRPGVTYDYETTPSYTVIVKADDGNGGTDTVTVTIDLTNDVNERPLAPATPRVRATPGTTNSLTVSWSAPSNTGRPAIESYDLQYREGTSGNWTGPQNETGTSATITGLTAAPTAYRVQVRATNSDGTGPWSPSGRIRTAPPPPVNNPPRAVDDAADTPEDTPVTISVLGNDSDPDRDTLTVVGVSAPTHGTAVAADTGEVVYTPEPDFHGTDSFTYVVGDGSGLTARAAVDVTVLPVDDPPLAGDDAADTPEDTPVTIDVLSNDSDGDGDALALVEVSAPTHGTAVTDTGAVVYTPEPDFHGTDSFTYVVGDGSGLTARAAVDVTVRPVNDAPLAAGVIPDRTLDIGDGPAVLDLIPFFADRDGDALDYTAVVSDQAVALHLTGATLTLTATRPGTATVTVTAQDPGGLTATQAFMVTTTDHQEARSVKAWLARFGRTVANHAVEAVRGRMSSVSGPSRGVTLGGAELKEPPATEITQTSPWDELVPEDRRPENLRNLRVREFLLSSSFEVSLAQNATQNPGPGWTAWGGAARTSFSGRDSDLSIDGDVTTATLGVDRAWDRVLLGLALGRSTGDGSYNSGDIRGDLKSSITSAHPYLRFSLNDRLSVWTLLGYGKGELTLTHSGGEEKTDIEMKMAALGARGALLASGGFDISARTDALLVRTSSEGTSRMAETEADVSRLRFVLEGSRPFASASGASLTPSVEVGVRRDGGDAERGVGFEVGGAMRYVNPSRGLTVEITARRLMAHEQSGYSEWGAGGSLQFAPGGAERGFSAKLGSSVGTTASGVEGLWAMGDTRGLTGGAQAPGRLDAEAGYAMGAFGGSGIITPYGGFSMSGDRRYRAGWRLSLGDSFNLSLEGDRTENPDSPSRHGVALRGDLRW